MSKNSRSDHFFVYPRFEDDTYTGHTICVILRNGRMYHGEALCSPKDQFNKNEGRVLAYDRALAEFERDAIFKGEYFGEAMASDNPYIRDDSNE